MRQSSTIINQKILFKRAAKRQQRKYWSIKKKRLCVTELVTPALGHQDEERLSVFLCPVIFLAGL